MNHLSFFSFRFHSNQNSRSLSLHLVLHSFKLLSLLIPSFVPNIYFTPKNISRPFTFHFDCLPHHSLPYTFISPTAYSVSLPSHSRQPVHFSASTWRERLENWIPTKIRLSFKWLQSQLSLSFLSLSLFSSNFQWTSHRIVTEWTKNWRRDWRRNETRTMREESRGIKGKRGRNFEDALNEKHH